MPMMTAIFTSETTTLTIETEETVVLEEMEPTGLTKVVSLRAVTHGKVASVGPGVFRILSNNPVWVTSDRGELWVASKAGSKDGPFPNPPKVTSYDALQRLFAARGEAPPRPPGV